MKLFMRFLGVLALCGFAINAFAFNGEKLLKGAKLSLADARAIATKSYPGDVTEEELRKSHSGSGLEYFFKIKDSLGVQLVNIDAKTGAVLKYRVESYQGK